MKRMKTTWARGGSHGQQAIRAINSYSTAHQSKDNHSKYDLNLAKLGKVFNEIGYFIPVILSVEKWITLVPKDIDLTPFIRVYVLSDCQSFYMLDALTGELNFYSCNGKNPDFSDDSIFNKLDGELL